MESAQDAHSSSGKEDETKYDDFVADSSIVDKYKTAAAITQDALKFIISKCVEGAHIATLCIEGDNHIEKLSETVYSGKKSKAIEKGIAFPTCISVNEICGHYSPLKEDSKILTKGNVVKIDLGCHIDGYVSQLSHTIVVGATKDIKVSGRQADVICCARKAFEAAVAMVKKGNTNKQVTDTIKKVCEEYKCNPLEGVLSHRVKRHMIDCNECIINKETFEQTVAEHKFEENEAYVIDILVSTGEGKPKESELRTTVYKRSLENTYILKTKTARQFFALVNKKYPTFPFSINSFEDLSAAKMGVIECINHDLLSPYSVLVEKEKEYVAQFKATLLINAAHTLVLNEVQFESELYDTKMVIADKALIDLLDTCRKEKEKSKPLTEEEKKKRKDKKKKRALKEKKVEIADKKDNKIKDEKKVDKIEETKEEKKK
jgi:curved DNA binding protein